MERVTVAVVITSIGTGGNPSAGTTIENELHIK